MAKSIKRTPTVANTNQNNNQDVTVNLPNWLKNSFLHYAIFTIFGFLLYANTLFHDFTQDDAIVIYDNMYTQQGISGISGLLKYDTFFGFFKEEGKEKLVSGGRYRPFTPIMFAIENQIFGSLRKDAVGNPIKDAKGNTILEYPPFVGHFFNIIWYIISGILMYLVLRRLLQDKGESLAILVSFTATLIFMAHPIHTEAVANIKGRDEIMALVGSLAALYFSMKAFDTNKYFWNIVAAILFFVGLMSKENTITFLGIIPFAYWFFTSASTGQIIRQMIPLLVSAIAFIALRTSVIGMDAGGTPWELMNNPFLKIVNGQYIPYSAGEKFATIMYTLGKYIQLMIAPITLTHDYYPYHVKTMTFGDPMALLSLALYAFLMFVAIKGIKTKSVPAFGIWFFLMSLSIVSNFVFPIGTNMSERFMFMPSVGFCLAICYLMYQKIGNVNTILGIVAIVCALFTFKTIDRNKVWKDNFTLFTTDVKTSSASAKLQNSVGGEYTTKGALEKDEKKKMEYLKTAIPYLQKAVEIHPKYRNAYLLMGNAYNYMKDYDNARKAYQMCLKIDPVYVDAKNNLALTYREAGKTEGERQNLPKAIELLEQAHTMNPKDFETVRLLGVASAFSGNKEKAIQWFQKSVEIEPRNAHSWWDLGTAYFQIGNIPKSNECRQKAKELDPNIEENIKQPTK